MIYGKTNGVRNTMINELEKIYDMVVPKHSVCTQEIVNIIAMVSSYIDREVSVAINRKGKVISVAIGDSTSVEIPLIDINEKKLSGIKIVHTHPNGICRLSALDVSALLKLKLDAIVAIALEDEKVKDLSVGFCTVLNDVLLCEEYPHVTTEQALSINALDKITHIEELIKTSDAREDDSEKAILVGTDSQDSLVELKELAKACDIPVVEVVYQNRSKIDTAFYIGKGKAFEVARLRQELRANLIIFDDELSGSQVRNLESATGVKVIDRTTLILEIFARRAKSREAKIQVELAQLKYRTARLTGLGTVLSRTGGGIGTRGPGEKKLEIDRRKIRDEIVELQKELKKIKKTREVQREKRNKQNIPQVSLVGYTNAGKSTLRNTICDFAAQDNQVKAKVFEADMLFATLDTTTRAVNLPSNIPITLTDTVGFVKKLPHELVEAFKSTLEEVIYSNILAHVVDASSEDAELQVEAVEEVLTELGAMEKATILVLNKIDLISEERLNELKELYKDKYKVVAISAVERINLDDLLLEIEDQLPDKPVLREYMIPYSDQQVVAYLHRGANILEEDYRDDGTYIKAQVDKEVKNKCVKFEIK
ncbi:GTPase HflX [uncultured Clostridium sp.]|uniref:GTPase HflX n=1 Tax=uncultured Clostridium sp. TaxID=59620 RepID=UPI002639A826|nr:GTPase HflX [uncultured Clostridium sp.]